MQRTYTQQNYQEALDREQKARLNFLNPLLVVGVLAIGISGFLLSTLIINPLLFALVYGIALFLGWHLGIPYYHLRQATTYRRRMEDWQFATAERQVPTPVVPLGYAPNDVHRGPDPDPRYYQQGYQAVDQGVPPQMV